MCSIFIAISTALLVSYFIFLSYLLIIIIVDTPSPQVQLKIKFPAISMVIPFRNEAHNLGFLIDSLLKQDYAGVIEILLVNDQSSDDYERALEPYSSRPSRLIRLISSGFNQGAGLTSKQQALDTGAAQANFDWLLFTDADMDFKPTWVASMTAMVDEGHDLIFGHTSIKKTGGLLSAMQSFQLEFLFAVAFAFQAANITGSCMGNNLLVKKESYRAIGGQKGIGYSIVEDCDLLREFKQRKFSVVAAQPFTAEASTYPAKSFSSFCSQALRWGRGGLRVKSIMLPAGLLFFIQNIFFLFALTGLVPQPIQFITYANAGLSILFIGISFKKIHSSENLFLLPVYFIFLIVESMAFFASFAWAPSLSWKGRKL